MREAMFWTAQQGGVVRCDLCRFHCKIGDGKRGRCRVRENCDGVLFSLNYGLAVASHVDPIEKKPLFHVYPGSRSYSIAAMGCNFRCLHCQNSSISQLEPPNVEVRGQSLSPQAIVDAALAADCRSIAYTYSEPTVFYEYAYDTACLAHEAGLANVFVSNGSIAEAPLRQLAPVLDAANIDLKGFSKDFYRTVCGGDLDQVLESLKLYRQLGIWLEVTTLLIPGYNDDEAQLQSVASFIVDNLGVETPWHVTAFYPSYRLLDVPPTPAATLIKAQQIGISAGLRYVYIGNVVSAGGENSICHECGQPVIVRRGFEMVANGLQRGGCPNCGTLFAGVGLGS
ncbi:MAG: AmmeMemoRadiSam system radical SAM enzyme [Thermodesulfobacteriota bacterium]|nr:AmmeMemoRadiSam system radical SAM enzyme [Thermodesulfobacteriota bacterium]